METFKEVSEAFKEFKKCVIARADTIGRLGLLVCQIDSVSKITRTVKRTSIPTKIRFAGWNGTLRG